ADARHRARRITEQKVGKRVARELAGVGKRAARVVGLLGPELEVKQVAAEFQVMRAPIDEYVFVQLEMLVAPEHERGGIAHRAVQAGGGDLGKPGVARVARD